MCKSLTNYFPRNNDFLVTYFGKTQNCVWLRLAFSRMLYCSRMERFGTHI